VFDRPVPCLIESDLLRKKVERVLLSSDLETWTPQCVNDLARFPQEAGVVVLEGRLLSQRAFRKALGRLRVPVPHLHGIVLLRSEEAVLRLPSNPPGEPCMVPGDLPLLTRRIGWARLDAWKSRVRRQLRAHSHLPPTLQQGLVAALGQKIPRCLETEETIHTINAVARKIGVSREYLSRAAGAEGIGLASYLDACNALNALAEAEIEERSWSEVAVRMGYSWHTGLTELLKRSLGVPPKFARSRSLGEWVLWWERHVLEPLLVRGDDGHAE